MYAHFSETLTGLSVIRGLRATDRFLEDNLHKLEVNQRANYGSEYRTINKDHSELPSEDDEWASQYSSIIVSSLIYMLSGFISTLCIEVNMTMLVEEVKCRV